MFVKIIQNNYVKEVEFMYNPQKTADRIAPLCKKNNITIKMLEELCGITGRHGDLTYMVKIGKYANVKYFCKMADVLMCSLDDIVDNDDVE